MHKFLFILLFLPLTAKASFLFQYGLNYSSQADASEDSENEFSRTFHKVYLAAAINGAKTFYLGWNINNWSSSLKQGDGVEDNYSILEMGPRIQWFLNDSYNLYFAAEWNPYARGDREKAGTSSEITASSTAFGIGYRFRISRIIGLGASIHYHSYSMSEEKVGNTETSSSDSLKNIMPMLEFSLITR